MAGGRSPLAVTLRASSAITSATTETGSSQDIGARHFAEVTLNVTGISGSGTSATLVVETSQDGSAWAVADTFPAVTAAGQTIRATVACRRYVRSRVVVAGAAPNVTLDVTATAKLVYAHESDLARFGVPNGLLTRVSAHDRARHVASACDELDTYHSHASYVLPLVSWGDGLRARAAAVTAWKILANGIGFNPEGNADSAVRTSYDDAIRLAKMQDPEIVDSTPDVDEGEAYIATDAPRNWSNLR